MSVFTGEGDQTDQSTQQNQQDDQTTDWLAKVVEQKGEKFQDPNELAKGYTHAQEHIQNLMTQIEEMKEDLGKQDYMKEVLDRLDANKAAPAGGETASKDTNSGTDNSGNQPAVSVEQIKELVTETLTKQEADNTARQNLEETDRQLSEAFGTDAKDRVEERRVQLGMTTERMKQLAQESPSAFMALMGEAPSKETNQTTTSKVNTAGGFNSTSNQKNWQHYQNLRKENPKLYYSARVQNEMLEERLKQGESAFYNR